MSKFEEISPVDEDDVISSYQHIDNGGFTISVSRHRDVTIQYGFYGYSSATTVLSGVDLDGLIGVLQKAKKKIEEEEIVERLKGNS